jgi:hypothetical protein
MNYLFSIRLFVQRAIIVSGISVTAFGANERFHLEPSLPSQTLPLATSASSISGGNVAQYPDTAGTVPHDSTNQIFLAESSLGYCGPTSEGGAATRTELNAVASGALAAGTFYKTTGIPGNWQIVFPGVVDLATGGQASGTTNFDGDQVQISLDYYRAVALAYPNDIQAKINFINAVRDLMVPYTYAGNNAFARATKERIINGPLDIPPAPGQPDPGNPTATDREDASLRNASGMYELAIAPFVDLMGAGDSLEVAFPKNLPGSLNEESQIIKDLRSSQRLLCSTYARATGFKGETMLRIYQLSYLKKYSAPTLAVPVPPDISALLSGLDSATRGLDYNLLITAPLESQSWFPAPEFSPARAFLGSAKDLRSAMQDGLLTFTGLDSSLNIKSNAYDAYYVPFFFDPFILSTPTTFSGLIGFAKPLATASETADNASSTSIGQLDSNLQSLATRLNDLNDQYNSQLGQLCGWKIVDVNGIATRTPDVDGAILPPEKRPEWQDRNSVDQGEIGLQWLEIDAAEQAMDKALLDLNNVLETIDKKRETWQLIKGSREEMIQNVILSTGQKIDQLNKDAIEAKAKFAEYQAILAKKKRKRGLFSGSIIGLAAVVAAPFTAGASLGFLGLTATAVATAAPYVAFGTTLVSQVASISSAYSDAGLAIKELHSQADLDRKLGEINAKKEELAYLEKAGMQFQQIEEDGYRTEEAIHALLLEVKSAELQIEMADLRVEREYAKLSTMLNRVAYLMQQHATSFSLVNTNPLNSPDFRIIRDVNVRDAEERFVFAQEWAFLTGRAAGYVALGSTRRSNIENINADILKARTGKRLNYLLDRLQAEMNLVTVDLGSRASQKVTISLRDQLVQHNNVERSTNGIADGTTEYPWESQQTIDPSRGLIAGNSEQISDAAWLDFLKAHLIYPTGPGTILKLQIPFRLTLNRWANPERPTSLPKNPFTLEAPLIENPLFTADRKGSVIFYSQNSSEFFGTRVDIQGSFTNINPTSAPVSVKLSPEGASYVREQTYANDPNGRNILVFQLGSNKSQASIEASINGVGLAGGTGGSTNRNAQLHERSPANDRWVLTIYYDATPNRRLLEQLDKMRDIRISFSLSSF